MTGLLNFREGATAAGSRIPRTHRLDARHINMADPDSYIRRTASGELCSVTHERREDNHTPPPTVVLRTSGPRHTLVLMYLCHCAAVLRAAL